MSDRTERLGAEAWRWYRLAAEDLGGSRRSAADPEDPPRLACFWAQQAGELALKAVLVAEDVDPPKTHDLAELASLCNDTQVGALEREELETLSAFAVVTRYPADAPDIAESTPAVLIAIASRVLDASAAALLRVVGPDPTDQTAQIESP